jgi:antitoxin ParD1/3/4
VESERLTIILTPELLEFIRERVTKGDYSSDSEAIGNGLRVLKKRDGAARQWLTEKVVPGYLQYLANPERATTREQIEQQLDRDRRQRRGKKAAAG